MGLRCDALLTIFFLLPYFDRTKKTLFVQLVCLLPLTLNVYEVRFV